MVDVVDLAEAVLPAALRYAGAGWPVFPCRAGTKKPATARGFKDATTDPDLITRWWGLMPTANVGIATGAPGPDVLDVDVRPPRGDGWAAYARLVRAGLLAGACARVRTRLDGLHVYFPGTGQRCGSRQERHFLDFKAVGGYVLARPSVVDGKPYVLLDHRPDGGQFSWSAACRLLDPPPVGLPAARRPTCPKGIGGLARWVARLREGNRNRGLFWAACEAVERGLAGELDELVAAAAATGLGDHEARRTVASAQRRVGGAACMK